MASGRNRATRKRYLSESATITIDDVEDEQVRKTSATYSENPLML